LALPPDNAGSRSHQSDLGLLTALGFGPDTMLMNDPKLFVDARFLASLLVELEDEMGADGTRLALFQIGLMHGFRDAERVLAAHARDEAGGFLDAAGDTTALVMRLTSGLRREEHCLNLEGVWPEQYEAVARLSRLGVDARPACLMSAGYTSGWLSATQEAEILACEVECVAAGGRHCRFVAREASSWRRARNDVAVSLLDEVPFEAIRMAAAHRAGLDQVRPRVPAIPGGSFDRSEPVVHIWGPVMVLPFTSIDEALGTVDMLGRDPGTAQVRVVIVDLLGETLDEGFGAAALEQVLESIESWGAEGVLTGVSPLSETTVAGLESSHLLIRKDLPDAIASAFQIVEAQRHLI